MRLRLSIRVLLLAVVATVPVVVWLAAQTGGGRLRTQASTVSPEQARAMLVERNFYCAGWNEEGADSARSYRSENRNSTPVVVDQANSLMWQKTGSGQPVQGGLNAARQFVRELNEKKVAGFSDWRLPTLEEAMSLTTNPKHGVATETAMGNDIVKSTMHLSPAFDWRSAPFIWTADAESANRGWVVYFLDGICSPEHLPFNSYVRAVRSNH